MIVRADRNGINLIRMSSNPYKLLLQAIIDASEGDDILLRPGQYSNPGMVIRKKVTMSRWPGQEGVIEVGQ